MRKGLADSGLQPLHVFRNIELWMLGVRWRTLGRVALKDTSPRRCVDILIARLDTDRCS
jgi:hypothetical protein